MIKTIRTYLPFVVTLVLLALVLRRIDVDELAHTLQQSNPAYLLLALAIGSTTIFTSAAKVKILLNAQGYDISFWVLLKNCFVGMFFNNFLPTNVGGDVVRSYEIGRLIHDQAAAAAAIFVERFTGFIVLIFLVCISLVNKLTLVENVVLQGAVLAAIAGLVGVAWLVLDPRLLNWVDSWMPLPIVKKYLGKFKKFQTALHSYRNHRRALVQNVLWSVVFYSMAFVLVYASISAFQRPISFVGVMMIVPITMIVAMMPMTFNGIGIQEWAYVTLFPLIGVTAPAALLGLVVVRIVTLLKALLGGVLYLQSKLQAREHLVSKRV